MAEEEKNQQNQENQENQENQQNQENQEEKSQEELAKEWEEALKAQQSESSEEAGEGAADEDIMSAWEEALKQQQGGSSEEEGTEESSASVSEEAIPEELKEEKEKFELLMDIPLEITVEIGSTLLPLEEILKLYPNSIVELDRYVNEPVDIKINGKLIAKGKLYTVKENFGIKITQIITPEERLKLLEE